MRTIKNIGLINLIKDGDLTRCRADLYAHQCLSSDLTIEEVKTSLSVIEDFLLKYSHCEKEMESLTLLKKEWQHKQDKLDLAKWQSNLVKSQKATPNKDFNPWFFLVIILCCSGFFVSLIAYLAGRSPYGMLIFASLGLVVFISSNEKKEKEKPSPQEEPSQEERQIKAKLQEIAIQEEEILRPMHVKEAFFACNLVRRLTYLKANLQKIMLILSDSSIGASDKIIRIETFLSLQEQKLMQKEQLKETRIIAGHARQQAEYSRQQTEALIRQKSEVERQTDYTRQILDEQQKQTQILKEKNLRG